jgi:hypothetical protein
MSSPHPPRKKREETARRPRYIQYPPDREKRLKRLGNTRSKRAGK